jgi:RNA polymerase sigma factor (sigma-70 family)
MAFKAKKSKAVESSTPASWSVAQFSSFYTKNRSELIAHANRIVKDKAKAEEITQEALVKFMLAAPELSSDDHALSYLHRTIENLCIDLFRAENRRPNLVALDDATAEVESTWQVSGDHSQAISSAEDAAIIRQALSLLSPAERAALVMWEVEGRSTAEIAKELGIKESAVRHTVSRARASLRKVLSELVIDEARGLTALDLLSTTYKKAAELTGKSSKIALTFILVLTAFLGLNSLTGNEPNTSLITTSSSQPSSNQDMPEITTPAEPAAPVVKLAAPAISNSISSQDYAEHMQLSLNQLETVTLMLQVLEQTDGGPAPTK